MKKLAMNILRTADEKLRNIGKHQSGTSVQTQNFTFYKNQPQREVDISLSQPRNTQSPTNRQPQSTPNQQQQTDLAENQPATVLQPPQQQPEPRDSALTQSTSTTSSNSTPMSQNVVLRQVRRDRNGSRAGETSDKAEIKRRSKSEGPNRRVRQSMDERVSGGKKQTFDGGGRVRRLIESSDSEDSQGNQRQTTGGGELDSESDSDPKKWTKNPLVVRRVKRSDKHKNSDKRVSGGDFGVGVPNRESWVYYASEETTRGDNSSSRDSGSSSKGSNKYQKLEEMRKKRIHMAVTSDEENTPASRISRLRQRALQGGLTEQIRTSNHAAFSNETVQWEETRTEQIIQQPSYRQVASDPSIHSLLDKAPAQRPSAPERPHVGPRVTPAAATPPSTHQSYTHSSVKPNNAVKPANFSATQNNIQPSPARNSNSNIQQGTNSNIQHTTVGHFQTSRTSDTSSTNLNPPHKQPPARPPPPNVALARQSFYSIPDSHPSQKSRNTSIDSPETSTRKFPTQIHLPTTDAIITASPKPNSNQPVTFSHNLRQIQARGSPTPNFELFQALNNSRNSCQFNEAVEIRLKTGRDTSNDSQHKPSKNLTNLSNSIGYSDDLDDLVESNIQYLDNDYEKSKTKRNSTSNVTRSSSLPDPRRMSSHVMSHVETHTVQQDHTPSIQVQANTSIEFHVSLPPDTAHNLMTPIIRIAPSNISEYPSDYSLESHLRSQPDVVPRKFSYDGHPRLSRPNSEYLGREDMSKSDSQLNAQVVIPSYLGNNLHPEQVYVRGCMSDINLRADMGSPSGLLAPQMDKGMFSDVEYDIEVSERVKKWETFMKFQDGQAVTDKKILNLTTIQENTEADSLMLPSEIRKSVLLSKNSNFGSPYAKETHLTPPSRSRQFNSDTSLHMSGDKNQGFKMFSMETSANKFFQIIPEPQAGPNFGIQSQSVTSLFHQPVAARPNKSFVSASELRQQMLANRQSAFPVTASSVSTTIHLSQPHLSSDLGLLSQQDKPSLMWSSTGSEARDLGKRASRYQEELNEINNVKMDSVISLRRRFDTESNTVTSEDDRKSVSTASAKLTISSKDSPQRRDSDSVDWSNVFPGYESRLKEAEVWSPNLESTKGVPVSIERVTARTLQTIPFSEDPFWKEIEEMTTFDPSSMAGHLSVNKTQDSSSFSDSSRSQSQGDVVASPHSSTLPNQPRNNTMPIKERMQRSKSLYTPNITPLSISVAEKTQSRAVSALDEVLEDINKSSMERRQHSPKKKALDTDTTTSTSSGLSKEKNESPKTTFSFEGGRFTFSKLGNDDTQQPPNKAKNQDMSEKLTLQSKQPLQFYQQQRQQHTTAQHRQSQMLGPVNNYHLDPNLLKEKLLNTGLVVETDTEEAITVKQARSSSLGALLSSNTSTSSYAPVTSQKAVETRTEQVPKTSASFIINKSVTAPAEYSQSPPWAVKQSGQNALDDIQKALAPFHSTSYQPGPETLYGTSRLQSFTQPSFNTSRGPQTTATGWTYQPQQSKGSQSTDSSPSQSMSRLQQVTASMDDLKDLAQSVERKINDIKSKLQKADEKSLDTILMSLRRLNPEVKSSDFEPSDFEDYYTLKKSKLSDALKELDRIYTDLELTGDKFPVIKEKDKKKPYRPSKSTDLSFVLQSKPEPLRPIQTKISSVYIPGLEKRPRVDLDKETESEFDLLSKSFQAIVDEVNQTSDRFSQATEKKVPDNTAPETHNQKMKLTHLKADAPALAKSLPPSNSEDNLWSRAPPVTAPKPQEAKPKGGRLRSKAQENTDEDASITRNRSKSVPELDSSPKDVTDGVINGAGNGSSTNHVTSITVTTVGKLPESSTPTNLTATAANIAPTPATTLTSSVARQRSRARPVKDNRIVQDDKATKKPDSDKVLGLSQSPKPSPGFNRKVIYNNALGELHPANKNDESDKTTPEFKISQSSVTKQTQVKEDNTTFQTAASSAAVASSPATQKKTPPPTAAKPSVKTEMGAPVLAMTSPQTTVSANKSSQLNAAVSSPLQGGNQKSAPKETNQNVKGQTKVSANSNRSLSSSVSVNNQLKASSSSGSSNTSNSSNSSSINSSNAKQQFSSDVALSNAHNARRKLGTGVAMLLDKFSTDDQAMIKTSGSRSAPDLLEAEREDTMKGDSSQKPTGNLTTETSQDNIASRNDNITNRNDNITNANVVTRSQQSSDKKCFLTPISVGANSSMTKPNKTTPTTKQVPCITELKAAQPGRPTHQLPSSLKKQSNQPSNRPTSDPDKVNDIQGESVVASPKFVSRIPRPVSASKPAGSGNSSEAAVKVPEHPPQKVVVNIANSRRVRPPDRKMQILKTRPHSFHELMSCSDKDPLRLKFNQRFRRYASADEVNPDLLVNRVCLAQEVPGVGIWDTSVAKHNRKSVGRKGEKKLKS